MPYKNVVLAGAGGLGEHILGGLLSAGATVTVFTRSGSKALPTGATAKVVDYSSETNLVSALKSANTEVVVSALSQGGFAVQPALAKAAKIAGVKLFVPSEYGNPTTGYTPEINPILYGKVQVQNLLKEINLPYALFFTGLFQDFIPFVTQFDAQAKTASVVGKGETLVSLTSKKDIGRFIGYAVTHLAEKDLAWRIFRIEGDRKTFLQAIDILSTVTNSKISVTHRDTDTTLKESASKGMPEGILDWLLVSWEQGRGSVSWDEATGKGDLPVDDGVWPEWKPSSVKDTLEAQLKR